MTIAGGSLSLDRIEKDRFAAALSGIFVVRKNSVLSDSDVIDWKELGRPDQNILQRLYGGGSLRNCDPDAVLRLRQLGLIEGKERRERLSPYGWSLLDRTHAQLKARLGAS